MTTTTNTISMNIRRAVVAAGIGLAILAPAYAAIETATGPTVVAGAGQDGNGGNNRDHARLGTGKYSMNNTGPQMRYTPPASGQYIGGIN